MEQEAKVVLEPKICAQTPGPSSITHSSVCQLPLNHPDYQYPPSRNIYAEKMRNLEGLAFADTAAESHRNQWRCLFETEVTNAQLHLEIGCNAGHVTNEWANRDPKGCYLGLDWKYKAIYRAAEKALKRKISNVRYIRGHAGRLDRLFGDEELDSISVFFPDPWPKKSQRANRFLNREGFLLLHKALKPGKILHIKTDHQGYFEEILQTLDSSKKELSWTVQSLTRDKHQGHPNPEKLGLPEVTLFERLFIRDKLPICELILRK